MPKKLPKKLNEILVKTQLGVLSLAQLGQRVQETIDQMEQLEKAMDQASAEVQRRLAKVAKPEERAVLEELATRISRFKLMRASPGDDALGGPTLKQRRPKHNPFDDDDFHGGGMVCMCSVPAKSSQHGTGKRSTARRHATVIATLSEK